nr:GFA family protein [Microbulbifer salipaludis]
MSGDPKVHAYCHCEDCRELLQVPFHSVNAWDPEKVEITRGREAVVEYQHPHKRMTRVFCKHCGEVLYNTNAMGWKLVSQLLYRKCNAGPLPVSFQSNAHFFYDRRVIDIDDGLPKQ